MAKMTKTKKENKKGDMGGLKQDELFKKLAELTESIRAIKFKAEGSKSKNVKEVRNLRKEVARVLTAMNQEHEK